jgi:hypothetical protein
MEIDRRALIASLGGMAAVSMMSSEARADALEDYASEQLDAEVAAQQEAPGNAATGQSAANTFPTVAELEAQIETRGWRRGAGSLFVAGRPAPSDPGGPAGHVKKLAPMPPIPTLLDFFKYRFAPANHVLQSATRAMKTGMPEEIVFACLMHDVVQTMIKPDHGWWGAQLIEPYVSKKVTFAIRYHQALRFYPDPSAGYEYPDLYKRTFGVDYEPPPYIEATYKYVRNHKWYMEPRLVTVNDLYAFDPKAVVSVDPFVDIMGRQFKQPKEGLGYDNSPVAHMWRTIANPDSPL